MSDYLLRLRERLLDKIVMPGPATPCATWVGAYNLSRGFRRGQHGRYSETRRPVVWYVARTVYVAPLLLDVIAQVTRPSAEHVEACHYCPTGTPVDGVYRCVDLAHLRWGTRTENEHDKELTHASHHPR